MFRKSTGTSRLYKGLIFSAFFFLLISSSYAEVINDLSVQADSISYSEDGSSIEANGSVEVSSSNVIINSRHIICNVADKQVIADDGFFMRMSNGVTLEGQYLIYSFKTSKGLTKNVSIKYRHSVLSGSFANIDEEKIELSGTSFNTCGLAPPHYHVSSSTTTLYPEEGWLIGYLGYLWIDGVPAVPVPVYLYDLSIHGTGNKTSRASDVLAFPEVGSNDEDGQYIVEKIPWIFNRKLNGRFVIKDSEYGRLAGGIEGNYIINNENDLNFRGYHDMRYEYYGGLTHTYMFGPKIGAEQADIYTFLNIKQRLLLELSTNVSVKERINYETVSLLPEVTLRLNDVPALWDNFYIAGEMSHGGITERRTEETFDKQDDRTRLKIYPYFIIPTDIGNFYAGLDFNQSWYSKYGIWVRLAHNFRLSTLYDNGMDSYISHMHYMLYDGNSPFWFEQYYTIPSDEIGAGLGYNFAAHRIGLDYAYYVPGWDPKDLDYILSIGMHCYNLEIKYRSTRKELVLGVSLTTW